MHNTIFKCKNGILKSSSVDSDELDDELSSEVVNDEDDKLEEDDDELDD